MNTGPDRPAGGPSGGRSPRRPGIAGRVESAARAQAPAPKGKGLVLMILGVVVVGALIWDFTGHSSASRAIERSTRAREKRPVAPPGEGEPRRGAAGPLELELRIGDARLRMQAEDALARFRSMEGEERETFRVQVLESLVRPAGRLDANTPQVFELAARFAPEAAGTAGGVLDKLRWRAYVALASDEVAPTAILFLKQLPDRGGAETRGALDDVILDEDRPLTVRVEAARARDDVDRPEALRALAADPDTHPSLRDALE